MRPRVLAVVGLVMAIGAGVGVAAAATSADAPPATASFTAMDFAWNVSGSTSTTANVAAGGTVTFGYPTGGSDHNADFGSGPQPSSCTQTAGASSGAVPPLPAQPTAPGWSGTCTFATAGTYTFHCDMHSLMTATIVVGNALPPPPPPPGGSTTSSQTTSTPGSTPAPTTTTTGTTPGKPTTPAPPSSALAGPARRAIVLAAVQHGAVVHGSLSISAAGRGGLLQIQLFAAGHRRAGSLGRRTLPAGRVRLAVALNTAARRALHRQHHLDVTVEITITSGKGARASVTRHVRMEADRGSAAGRIAHIRPAALSSLRPTPGRRARRSWRLAASRSGPMD
jgi:plastocyanin